MIELSTTLVQNAMTGQAFTKKDDKMIVWNYNKHSDLTDDVLATFGWCDKLL